MAQASTTVSGATEGSAFSLRQLIGLVLGPALFILMLVLPNPSGMTPEAAIVAATTLWIATWWITEAIPIPATSLLPLVVLPLLGALKVGDIAPPYADPLIFLFIGGFMIALAIERWGLHRRIALWIISLVGVQPRRIVLGFMVATGLLSAWISNTATALMMVPIGLAVVKQMADITEGAEADKESLRQGDYKFGTAIMLGIAYSASLGGIATLIGTPPNIVLASQAQELAGVEITFARWMIIGVPLAVIGIALSWLYLTRIAFSLGNEAVEGAGDVIKRERTDLGPMSAGERGVLVVFSIVAFLWITRQWFVEPFLPNVNDTVIALAGALVLFAIPVQTNADGEKKRAFLLDWETAKQLPWGVVLLFGGGLALAEAFAATDLSKWMGEALGGLGGLPAIVIILAVVALVIFLTEVTSNTATATVMMPVMAALAGGVGIAPLVLMSAAAVAASCAFMLPVATPPNAIVFGSGYVTIPQMSRAGLWLNIGGVFIVTAACYFLIPLIWSLNS